MRAVLRIRKEPVYRREAFEKGLRRVGFKLADKATPTGPESWLVLWNRQGAAELEADAWEARGGTVIVCENAYLQKVDKTFYAISVHGHNNSGWFPHDPTEDRFSKLGFNLKPWRVNYPVDRALVLGQRGIGSREMKSPPGWGEKTLAQRSRQVDFKVDYRPHPGNGRPRVPLTEALRGSNECVIWSSAGGVLALVEGVHVFYAAPHWICSDAALPISRFPSLVDYPRDRREAVLNRMAHNQWHFEEIATGEPFARIIANRKEASW